MEGPNPEDPLPKRYIKVQTGCTIRVGDAQEMRFVCNRVTGVEFVFFDHESADTYIDALNSGEVTP